MFEKKQFFFVFLFCCSNKMTGVDRRKKIYLSLNKELKSYQILHTFFYIVDNLLMIFTSKHNNIDEHEVKKDIKYK